MLALNRSSAAVVFFGGAVAMTIWIHASWPISAAACVLAGCVLARELPSRPVNGAQSTALLLFAAAATIFIQAALLTGPGYLPASGDSCAAMGWLIAAAIVSTTRPFADFRTPWRALALMWAAFGMCVWLEAAYLEDRAVEFYVGLAVGIGLVILAKTWFRLPAAGIYAANTLIVLLLALPLADLALLPADHPGEIPKPEARAYSFAVATAHPEAFALWWDAYLDQVHGLFRTVEAHDPRGTPKYRLKPGSTGAFFDSRIAINSKGFRGPEISEPRGDTYRIVALGESTTFGFTLSPDERPWPELLEQFIRERLHPARPVEVINAGVPSLNLKDNCARLESDILPLEPNMIISYHGANGYSLLGMEKQPPPDVPPPMYRKRPLKLLARCEYHLKMMFYRKRKTHEGSRLVQQELRPLESDYAGCYRRLISVASSNHVHLVLATYSMAVNSRSDPRVIRFYEQTFPDIDWLMKANEFHSEIVRSLASANPGVTFVDTLPSIDGKFDDFIDLMHFSPEGERAMAETMFEGIRPVLEADLKTKPGSAAGTGSQADLAALTNARTFAWSFRPGAASTPLDTSTP